MRRAGQGVPPPPVAAPSAPVHRASGLAYALAGFSLLTCGDAVIKTIAGEWPGTAVAALRFAIGAAGLGVIVALREGRSGFKITQPLLHLARGATLAFGTWCFFFALFVMPLAEATTITFINPVFAAIFSMLFLKERAPQAIWIAMALGFAGVVLVLRPNVAEIGWMGILPLGSAAAMATLMVLNRIAGNAGSLVVMQFSLSVATALFSVTAAIAGHLSGIPELAIPVPHWSVVARCVIVAVTATSAHSLIYLATMRASAGAVAPMIYGQLIIALLIGIAAFAEYPDAAALTGACLVIGGGLYLWWKSAR